MDISAPKIDAEVGLGREVLLAAAVESVRERFGATNGWREWVVEQIAWFMIRISQCQRAEQALRECAALRARDFWELDQQVEAESLALKLPRQPGKTVARLRQSRAGSDWLLARWRSLVKVEPTAWSEEQVALAMQLAGGAPEVNPAAPGFAATRVAELEAARPAVERHDALVRRLVEDGLSDAHVPGLAQLRAEQRSLDRRMARYTRELRAEPAPAPDVAQTKPMPTLAAPAIAKTKPTVPPIPPRIPQTNPFSPNLPTHIDGEEGDWVAEMREFALNNPSFSPLPGTFAPVPASGPARGRSV